VKLVVHLTCEDEEAMIARIRRRAVLENRPDDASESVTRKRFEVYRKETLPVLDYYPKAIIREVESTGIHAEVLLECLRNLVPVLKTAFIKPKDVDTWRVADRSPSAQRFEGPPMTE
jgi:adenylate kinase